MTTVGFIGLGVMGAPICRNMAAKHRGRVVAFDLAAKAREAIGDSKARLVAQVDAVWESATLERRRRRHHARAPAGSEREADVTAPARTPAP